MGACARGEPPRLTTRSCRWAGPSQSVAKLNAHPVVAILSHEAVLLSFLVAVKRNTYVSR